MPTGPHPALCTRLQPALRFLREAPLQAPLHAASRHFIRPPRTVPETIQTTKEVLPKDPRDAVLQEPDQRSDVAVQPTKLLDSE